jgi:hypothetical protein
VAKGSQPLYDAFCAPRRINFGARHDMPARRKASCDSMDQQCNFLGIDLGRPWVIKAKKPRPFSRDKS